ncbi:hypothetical protein LXL04_015842 [Taraxacum kok-saghyz]
MNIPDQLQPPEDKQHREHRKLLPAIVVNFNKLSPADAYLKAAETPRSQRRRHQRIGYWRFGVLVTVVDQFTGWSLGNRAKTEELEAIKKCVLAGKKVEDEYGDDTIVLGSFENSYIPENPRTPPISYISQTVIPFKKPTSEPSKTFRMNKIR